MGNRARGSRRPRGRRYVTGRRAHPVDLHAQASTVQSPSYHRVMPVGSRRPGRTRERHVQPSRRPSSARPHPVKRVQGGVVGVGEGVQVALAGGDVGVILALLDHVKVSAAGEEPTGVGMTKAVDTSRQFQPGGQPKPASKSCG